MGQRDLLPSMTMDQDFPGKVIHCRQVFCYSIAQWSIEEDDVVIGKGKTRGKNGKTEKCAEEQDRESTDNFENYDSRRLLMLLYQGL